MLTREAATPDGFDTPCSVPDQFISGLQNCCHKGINGALEPSPRLAVGTWIKIKRGPLIAYEGPITAY